MLNGNLL